MNGNLKETLSEAVRAWASRGLDAPPVGGVPGWSFVAVSVAYVAIVPLFYWHWHIVMVAPFLVGLAIAEVLPKSRQRLVTHLRIASVGYIVVSPFIFIMIDASGF